MRIEDLDRGRCRPRFEEAIYADLEWLGLDWDEGPRIGGHGGPYRQSECASIYAAEMARLDVYPCVCTRREIREAVSAPHGSTPVYPGTCSKGISGDAAVRSSWRVRVPELLVQVHDRLAGDYAQDIRRDVGDFIVRRADGAFAYQLAVVVDDERMGVSEVYRGTDLLDSTPRQVFLQRELQYRRLSYAHVPLVRGDDGAKLNKRHGAPDLSLLREAGVDPRTVVAALARSLGLLEGDSDLRLSARECVALYCEAKIRDAGQGLPLEAHESWPSNPA
jgi:glutamyl-tRNA synthetase